MLSVRYTLLSPPGASRDGDGDGVNEVPQNTWEEEEEEEAISSQQLGRPDA